MSKKPPARPPAGLVPGQAHRLADRSTGDLFALELKAARVAPVDPPSHVYEAGKSGIAQRTKHDPEKYGPQIKRFVKRIKY